VKCLQQDTVDDDDDDVKTHKYYIHCRFDGGDDGGDDDTRLG
jgi:hypothetical protein